ETVEVSTSPPRVPLTPMLYVPGGVVPGDSVSVVDEFAASRLAAKLACAPCGTPVAASVALPENPVFAGSAMVEVADAPFEVMADGFAPSEKVPDGGGVGGGLFVAVEPSAFTAKLSITACVV